MRKLANQQELMSNFLADALGIIAGSFGRTKLGFKTRKSFYEFGVMRF